MTELVCIEAAPILGVIDSATSNITMGVRGVNLHEAAQDTVWYQSSIRVQQLFCPNSTRKLTLAKSFSDDFYNRFFINPNRINVGNLVEDSYFKVTIFNAYTYPQQILATTLADGLGINFSKVSTPTTLQALSSIEFSIAVTLDGPAVINSQYTFEFSNPKDLQHLTIVGSRVMTFGFEPNWNFNVEESYTWNTQILTARSGKEQRIPLKATPRICMGYTTTQTGEALNHLDSLLVGWGLKPYVVPLWWFKSALTAPVDKGSLTLYCDTRSMNLKQGDLAVVWQNALKCETVDIQSVNVNSVMLKQKISKGFESGFVIPAKFARISAPVSLEAATNGILEASINFEFEDDFNYTPFEFQDKYRARQIIPYTHNYKSSKTRTLAREHKRLDGGYGLPIFIETQPLKPVEIFNIKDEVLHGAEELQNFRRWLYSIKGCSESFYSVLQENQLMLTRDIMPGSGVIHIKNLSYGLLSSYLQNRNELVISTKDHKKYIIKIDSYNSITSDIVLFTKTKINSEIKVSDVAEIGFLTQVRSDTDSFKLQYVTEKMAIINLQLRGCYDDI